MKSIYKFKEKEFENAVKFLTEIHSYDYEKIKNEIIEIKCPIVEFIGSSDIYKSERLYEVLRENPHELVEAIINHLKRFQINNVIENGKRDTINRRRN